MWPALRDFDIIASPVLPNGRWMFTGNPDSASPHSPRYIEDDGSENSDKDEPSPAPSDCEGYDGPTTSNGERPSHLWRDTVDPDAFGAMVREMTCAVQSGQMPLLQGAALEVRCALCDATVLYRGQGIEKSRVGGDWAPKEVRAWELRLRGHGLETLESVISDWKEWVGEEGVVRVINYGPR